MILDKYGYSGWLRFVAVDHTTNTTNTTNTVNSNNNNNRAITLAWTFPQTNSTILFTQDSISNLNLFWVCLEHVYLNPF